MGLTLEDRRKAAQTKLQAINAQINRRQERADAQAEAKKGIPEAEAVLDAAMQEEANASAFAEDATGARREAQKKLNALKVAAGQPVRPRKQKDGGDDE